MKKSLMMLCLLIFGACELLAQADGVFPDIHPPLENI